MGKNLKNFNALNPLNLRFKARIDVKGIYTQKYKNISLKTQI